MATKSNVPRVAPKLAHEKISERTVDFLRSHGMLFLALISALFLAALFVVIYKTVSDTRLETANATLEEGIMYYYGVQNARGQEEAQSMANLALSNFNVVADTYAGSPAAARANLYIGAIYYDSQSYDSALIYWRKVIAKQRSPFAPIAFLNVMTALYEQRKFDETIEQYKTFVRRYQKTYVAAEAAKIASRAYLGLNDRIEAIETLKRYLRANSDDEKTASEFASRIALIEAGII